MCIVYLLQVYPLKTPGSLSATGVKYIREQYLLRPSGVKLPKDLGRGDEYLSRHFDGFDAAEQRFKPNALTAFRNGLYCPLSFSDGDNDNRKDSSQSSPRRSVLVSSVDGEAEGVDMLLEQVVLDLLAVLRDAMMNVAIDVHNIRPLGGDDKFIHSELLLLLYMCSYRIN